MFKNNNKGFTLIELLVVIAIIGILSSVVLASLNTARKKARDTRRLADLKQVQLALELYFDTHGYYPETGGQYPNDCNPQNYASWNAILSVLVTENFLPSLPHDPLYPNNPDPWCYFYYKDESINCGGAAVSRPYTMLFSTEKTTYDNLPAYTDLAGAYKRYCITP